MLELNGAHVKGLHQEENGALARAVRPPRLGEASSLVCLVIAPAAHDRGHD